MFRHEKTFVHPTAIAAAFSDDQSIDELRGQAAFVRDYCLERVGEQLMIDLVLVANTTTEVEPFAAAVKEVASTSGRGLISQSATGAALEAALQAPTDSGPLFTPQTSRKRSMPWPRSP